MYIEYVKNRHSPGCLLLRKSFRLGGKVKKRSVANLTDWPPHLVQGLRQLLRKGKSKGSESEERDNGFTITRSLPHGHVAAVLGTMNKLGLPVLLDREWHDDRQRTLGMVAARILNPLSKLATAQGMQDETASSSLGEALNLNEVSAQELYEGMNWAFSRQAAVEKKLAARHLAENGIALYDVTSTWYEGEKCPLAAQGHSSEGKKGKKQIKFGLLCDPEGRPVAVDVYSGNTADPSTVASQIRKLKQRFQLKRIVLVGDRGMLTEARLREDLDPEGDWLSWITALRAPTIQKLARKKLIQPSLFDHTDIAEITDPNSPNERLIVCQNPFLADERARTREELMVATEKDLTAIVKATTRARSPLRGKDAIGVRVGKVIDHHKMAKHFTYTITDTAFTYQRCPDRLAQEAALDGIYVIRTNVPASSMSSTQAVGAYKSLSHAERAFRSMKTVLLHTRPIYHHLEDRVRAHVFLCMLAYYVEWHLRQALAPILFQDDDAMSTQQARASIVAPAKRSQKARDKAATKRTEDDYPVQSLRGLLDNLATLCQHTIQAKLKGAPTFTQLTQPTRLQQHAFDLLHITL